MAKTAVATRNPSQLPVNTTTTTTPPEDDDQDGAPFDQGEFNALIATTVHDMLASHSTLHINPGLLARRERLLELVDRHEPEQERLTRHTPTLVKAPALVSADPSLIRAEVEKQLATERARMDAQMSKITDLLDRTSKALEAAEARAAAAEAAGKK
jgi:hypothetical protein